MSPTTVANLIEEHRFAKDRYRYLARTCQRDMWPQGRRQCIESALWHREEVRRLRRRTQSTERKDAADIQTLKHHAEDLISPGQATLARISR